MEEELAMAEDQYLYAVARIRTKELSLLSASFFEQLLSAPDYEACIRLLREKGWEGGQNDWEEMLSRERQKTWKLMEELLEDLPYYRESVDGGVTFSGGECMLQLDFLEEMLRRLKAENIHTAVDTAGNVPYADFERILPFTDLFLYDMKAFHEDVHRALTGVSNERIKDNLLRLKQAGAQIKIRIPVIEELNAGELPFMRDFLFENGIRDVELLAYHRMGVGKGELLLDEIRQEGFEELSAQKLEEYNRIFFGNVK